MHSRRRCGVLAHAVALLATVPFVHPATADVRPALEVFVAGPPRAAAARHAFTGTFEFRAGAPLALDSLRLSGERWRVGRFRPALPHTFRAGEVWRVSFRATPADPARPLVLAWFSGRQWYRKEFDLSPAAIARVRGPGGVAPVPPR